MVLARANSALNIVRMSARVQARATPSRSNSTKVRPPHARDTQRPRGLTDCRTTLPGHSGSRPPNGDSATANVAERPSSAVATSIPTSWWSIRVSCASALSPGPTEYTIRSVCNWRAATDGLSKGRCGRPGEQFNRCAVPRKGDGAHGVVSSGRPAAALYDRPPSRA